MDTIKEATKIKALLVRLAIEDKLPTDMNDLSIEMLSEALKDKPSESIEGVTYFVDVPSGNGQEEWNVIKQFDTKEKAIDFAKKHFGADDDGMVCLISES